MTDEVKDKGVNNEQETVQESTDTPEGSSPSQDESQETSALEAEKSKLEGEISGLEGTRKSILEDVERARQERKEAKGEVEPEESVEDKLSALKSEFDEKLKSELATRDAKLLKQQADLQTELIKSKKATLDGIKERMASASGAKGQSSPDDLAENEVELSAEERRVAEELKLENPRYMKEVEVRGL